MRQALAYSYCNVNNETSLFIHMYICVVPYHNPGDGGEERNNSVSNGNYPVSHHHRKMRRPKTNEPRILRREAAVAWVLVLQPLGFSQAL